MSATVEVSEPFLSRDEIERRAREVVERYNLTTVPTDVIELAAREGIKLNNAEFDDPEMAGMIFKQGDTVQIVIKTDDPPLRKRFTIAHELGHYYLHLTGDGHFADRERNLFRMGGTHPTDPPERRREIQANLFAAALLMPADPIRRRREAGQSIESLARDFRVSTTALGYRLESLGVD